ncbi:MAG TPA: TIM-barrel domain-containing protein [Solimonas sp.]|nr:TIM-barrel domain-containing protein [Solimonas sp.]
MDRSSATLALAVTAALCGCGHSRPAAAPGAASGDWIVDAGALKLVVEPDPWRMRLVDAQGAPVLEESSASGTGPIGTLGVFVGPPPEGGGALPMLSPVVAGMSAAPVQRNAGWIHATSLTASRHEGAQWIATLATTDPLRTLELRAEARGDGVIAFSAVPMPAAGVQAMGIAYERQAGERFFGFGERSNAVGQEGNTLEHYVGEGPYQDLEYPFVATLVPKWGIRWRRDATYFPIPWLLSSRGVGVLLDNDELSYHRLADDAAWSMEAESSGLRWRVFAGPTPADALRRFSAAVGRQPGQPPPWFFGPWVQPDEDARIAQLRQADVPTSVTATYTHYLPCGAQQGSEQAQTDRVQALNAQGTAVHTYFNPMICTSYAPAYAAAQAAGALLKDRLGQTYTYPYVASTVFTVGQFDFTAPGGIPAYRALTDEAIAHGYEGWMEDFGEYTPLDGVAADGATGTRAHNRYARDYHCGVAAATAQAGKPLARMVRSGWTGSAACSPIVWGGDPTSGFGFDGLQSSIYQALSIGTSGVGIWGSDIGGFFALGNQQLSGELLDRWIAFGALSAVMRNQANGTQIPDKARAQLWEPAHLPLWRRYAKLHTQLYPYVQAALDEYFASGLPVMRHLALAFPDDAQAVARDDEYLFGPDLLVAPVYQQGATTRELYLPPGKWIEWWRAVGYDEANGSFSLGPATVLDGGRSLTVDAPIGEIPIFVRAGASIPMLSPDVQTLATHGSDPAIVHLADRVGRERVLHFPAQ